MYTDRRENRAAIRRPVRLPHGVCIDMTRDAIGTDKQLVAPVGPFSLGVRGAGLLFLSGQVAQDPATGRLLDGDVAEQTHQILRNIATSLDTVGKSLADVV